MRILITLTIITAALITITCGTAAYTVLEQQHSPAPMLRHIPDSGALHNGQAPMYML
jgi:hypothetical protein